MEPIYGNYLGIVVFSDDPENRERVQVFIPHLSCTIYKDWNEKLTDTVVKNHNSLPPSVLEKLRKILPWAEVCKPSFGGGTAGIQSPYTGGVGVAGNLKDSLLPLNATDALGQKGTESGVTQAPQNSINTTPITPYNFYKETNPVAGVMAAQGQSIYDVPLTARSDSDLINYIPQTTIGNPTPSTTDGSNSSTTPLVNPSYDIAGIVSMVANYLGSTGAPSGAFSVPQPGAKVWVFFYGGDIQKPVYFGVANDPSSSGSVYGSK